MNTYIFTSFFQPLKLFAVTEETIVIEAPNIMVVNSLRARYYQTLSNVLGATFGRAYDISILTAEDIQKQYKEVESTMLDPKYTFENFVVGNSNSFAHAAALAVADDPSAAYNPLFIYGGVGLGKTHLMNAIGNYVQKNDPRKNVLFITSEMFTTELIDAHRQKEGHGAAAARACATWTCFWWRHTVPFQDGGHAGGVLPHLNHLYTNGKQIILSSDRPPKDIPPSRSALRSRFEWG